MRRCGLSRNDIPHPGETGRNEAEVNSTTLLIGAVSMIGLGLLFIIVDRNANFVSVMAVGMGLAWIGFAVKP